MNEKRENVIEIEETVEMQVVPVEESKFKKTMTAFGQGLKKHKKKIIAGAAIIGGGILLALLSKRNSDNYDFDYTDDMDEDLVEVDDTDSETVEVENI